MTGIVRSRFCHAPVRVARSTGMTLLEVMLALSLTTVVLVAISMAIDLHLRMLDARRDDVQRIQVARGVLQIIGNDLRAAIQQNTTDFSALSSMATDVLAGGDMPSDMADLAGGAEGSGDTGSVGGGDAASILGDLTGDSSVSTAGQDIATTSIPPPVPGVYGNQYELSIDISRLPRVDEMQRMVASGPGDPLQDIPSDVKTVAYYYYDPNSGTSTGDFRDRAGNPQSGLVRRVLDRAVTLHASGSANVRSLQQEGEILAPEVTGIEFQYSDGTEWLYEWDSEEKQGLPVAVRITLKVGNVSSAASASHRAEPVSTSQTQVLSEEIYSLVVRLPTALPATESETTDSSGMESVGL